MPQSTIIIVGAGIFGVTAAVELQQRGHAVRLLDPGPVPHPLAASTDISKAVRMEYGADEQYVALAEQAMEGWMAWNQEWGQTLFHETGVLFARRSPAEAGSFEGESHRLLQERGHRIERLDAATLAGRFPAWKGNGYVEAIFNPEGGYVESGAVVRRLAEKATAIGVEITLGIRFDHLLEKEGRVIGIDAADGSSFFADRVVMAVGSWTPHLLPSLRASFRSNGMPVFHLCPVDPSLFQPGVFPVFGADITATGYYGFPANDQGIVKIANHGQGREMHPHSREREVTPAEIAAFRAFLEETFPSLAGAPLVYSRVCLYCDTWDGDFWIAPDPNLPGLVVATGGSGHAFKFAPVLGSLIADAVEGRENTYLPRFRWRPETRESPRREAARKDG